MSRITSNRVEKQKYLEEVLAKYVNENNILDIYKFRQENPNLYALIPHYFGSVANLLDSHGWVKIQKLNKNGNTMTLRNRLALDRIEELRKSHTLEEIAQQYGVTRALINQLNQALKKTQEPINHPNHPTQQNNFSHQN